jgi:hypothetical protein
LDLFVNPNVETVARMLAVVTVFGFPAEGVAPDYLIGQRKICNLEDSPSRFI